MKKTILAATLAAFSVVAPAASVFVGGEYDNANAGQAVHSQYETRTGVVVDTAAGAFDAALLARRIRTSSDDNGLGFEIGYTKGLKVGTATFTGRVGYGRVNRLQTQGGGFAGNTQYLVLQTQGTMQVADRVSAVVDFRHRNGINSSVPSSANRYAAGLVFGPFDGIKVNAVATHTRQAGIQFNGVAVTTSYSF